LKVEPGRVVYIAWLNENGVFDAHLTITRLEQNDLLVFVGENSQGHKKTWMHRHVRDDDFVTITGVTDGITRIKPHAPKARDVLQSVSETDLSDAAFPCTTARHFDVGIHRVLALRLTYVGKLVWELHLPVTQALQAFDLLTEAGAN
jgi:4-methylaminobutanoate oxidase (formaldehyde-forming)